MHNLLQWLDNFQPSIEAAIYAFLAYVILIGLFIAFGQFLYEADCDVNPNHQQEEDACQQKYIKEYNENHKATSRKTRW